MLPKTYHLPLTTLLSLPLAASATTIHRCDAPDGGITFTTMSCAAGDTHSSQEVHAYLPGTPPPLLPDITHRETSGIKSRKPDLTIVGQPEDKCGNLINARERRDAIINRRVIAGMSQQDVESALGKPDKVSIRSSGMSYRYDKKRGRSAQIEFDEKGCTKGKAKSQTAKSPH